MQRVVLRAKIHRATVTDADLDYEGSCSLGPELLEAADLVAGEQVHVVHGDSELAGGCLGQTLADITLGLGGELDLLLAGSSNPPGEPLSCQVGVGDA